MSPIVANRHVRLLTDDDQRKCLQFCAREEAELLTLKMNLEVYGLNGPILQGWGAFCGNEISGILLRYNNTLIAADTDGSNADLFAPIIDDQRGIAGIRGSDRLLRRLRDCLTYHSPIGMETSVFMHCTRAITKTGASANIARKASYSDLDRLSELYAGAQLMYRGRSNVAAKLSESRVWIVEDERRHRIVSCALLNMESSEAGLIGGVYTLPSARGKGYASACTEALSADLQKDGKLPCLFYENPAAGRIYRKLGFEETAFWSLLYLEPRKYQVSQ